MYYQFQRCTFRSRSEIGMLITTILLTLVVRQISSPVMLGEVVFFLLGNQKEPELPMDSESHALRYHLIEHCDHISDEVGYMFLYMCLSMFKHYKRNVSTS